MRQLRQAKIENLDPAISGDEQVLWLEVSMHNSLFVRCRQTMSDLHSVIDDSL